MSPSEVLPFFGSYVDRLAEVLRSHDWRSAGILAEELVDCWRSGRQIFLIGNGGSAGNAIHIANDFLYGVAKRPRRGLRIHALTANTSVLTCLANDVGYENVFAYQLGVLAHTGDVLIAFSGSGNSPNILEALKEAREIGMKSFAVLGYSGGQAKQLADVPIHFAIKDMQISEDAQIILGHMLMQWLYAHRDQITE